MPALILSLLGLQTVPPMIPVGELLDCARNADATLVAAHRAGGFEPGIPENSLAGIRRAADLGAAFAEVDLSETADGEIVLMHDATLERTTTGRGSVSDFSLSELRELYLQDSAGRTTQERIPTLDEALALARQIGIYLELDLKGIDAIRIAEHVEQAGLSPYNLIIVYDNRDAGPIQSVSREVGISLPFADRYEVLNSELDFDSLLVWGGLGIPDARTQAFLGGQGLEDAMHNFPAEADGSIDYALIDQLHVDVLASDDPAAALQVFGRWTHYCGPDN